MENSITNYEFLRIHNKALKKRRRKIKFYQIHLVFTILVAFGSISMILYSFAHAVPEIMAFFGGVLILILFLFIIHHILLFGLPFEKVLYKSYDENQSNAGSNSLQLEEPIEDDDLIERIEHFRNQISPSFSESFNQRISDDKEFI